MRIKEVIESWENYTTTPRQKHYKVIAKQINRSSITIDVKANDEGFLFEPVSSHAIIPALLQQSNIDLLPDLANPSVEITVEHEDFKELGLYNVKLSLDGVEAELKTWIVPMPVF